LTPIAQGDRLTQLLIKGLLYESCVEHCQARATNTNETIDLTDTNSLLNHTRLSDTDVSLLSWLHSLPNETFSCPFEQKALSVHVDKLQKPVLEATWTEHVLSTPFKPQTMFPFNATPTGKPRSMEFMSRSLAPQYDGLSNGLIRSQISNDFNAHGTINGMTRSLAVSHLKDNETIMALPTVDEVLYEDNPTAVITSSSNSSKISRRTPSPRLSLPIETSSNRSILNGSNPSQYKQSAQHVDNTSADRLLKVNDNLISIIIVVVCIYSFVKEFQKSRSEIIKYFDDQDDTQPAIDIPTTSHSTNNPRIRSIHDVIKHDSLNVCSSSFIYSIIDRFEFVRCRMSLFFKDMSHPTAFVPLVSLEDIQAIRAVDVHPTGKYFAVGSNSKILRVCVYPDTTMVSSAHVCQPARVLFKKGKHHMGSIYCMGWSSNGRMLATGSNDKLIKIIRLDMDKPDDTLNSNVIFLSLKTRSNPL
jgi:WD40 repeat protein